MAQEKDDEAFDDALKSYGYSGGAAWQCGEEDVRETLAAEATTVFNRLTQLFGTDRAFLFAASFGAGSVDEIDAARCGDFAAGFAGGMSPGIPAEGER
jgi:hypothetical protein